MSNTTKIKPRGGGGRSTKRALVEVDTDFSSDFEPKLSARQVKKQRLEELQLSLHGSLLCSRNNRMLPEEFFDLKPDGSYYKCCRGCKMKLDATRAAEKEEKQKIL